MVAADEALMRRGQMAPDKLRVCETQTLVDAVEMKQLWAGGKVDGTHKELAAVI